jgi:hypothetical protein
MTKKFSAKPAQKKPVKSDVVEVSEAIDDTEAQRILVARGTSRFGTLDVARIVAIVQAACLDADFSVQAAGLDASIDRYAAIKRDGLHVLDGPSSARPIWRVGNPLDGSIEAVRIISMQTFAVSCSCEDFQRASLGLCSHSLLVLEEALASGVMEPTTADLRPQLTWNPVCPLRGAIDALTRLRVEGAYPPALDRFVSLGAPLSTTLSDLRLRQEFLTALAQAINAGEIVAEPGAAKLVSGELRRVQHKRVMFSALIDSSATLKSLKRSLYGYQKTAVMRFLRTGSLLLADDMGLGKSTQAAAGCHALLSSGSVDRVLLIVPHSLRAQWAREWRATTDQPLTIVEGAPEHRAATYADTARGALMVGYEQLLRDIDFIRAWGPEVVVLDEGQRIKNHTTKSAATVKSLSPRYRLVLTGTPLENRLPELASLVEFIDDLALGPKWRLLPFHTYNEGDGGEGRSGARNLDVLRERLAPIMLRRGRNEAETPLPPRTDTHVSVELSAPQQAEHEYLEQPIAVLVSIAAERPLTFAEQQRLMSLFTRQRIIANGLAQFCFEDVWDEIEEREPTDAVLATLFTPKLGALRSLVLDLAVHQQKKIVVFSQWRRMARLAEWAVRDLLASAGLRAAFFTGAESSKQRERALVDFHDDPAVAVLFLTDAGGVGLNLQRAASVCVELEVAWNPAVIEQRIGRVWRPGQRDPVDVYHLVTQDSIEAHIAGLVGRKRALFSTLFDGDADTVAYDQTATFLSMMSAPLGVATAPAVATPTAIGANGGAASSTVALDSKPVAMLDTATYRITERSDGGLSVDVPPAMAERLAEFLASLEAQAA